LVIDPLDRAPRKRSPTTTSAAISGWPKARTRGTTAGIMASARNTGMTPPNIELVAAAPIARAPSPRWLMGKPSSAVAAFGGVPGMLSRIAGMLPLVKTTACMAIRRMRAISGDMPKMNGSSSGITIIPLRPGMAPTTRPMRTAPSSTSRLTGWNSVSRAEA
jgi:hypothetical protein